MIQLKTFVFNELGVNSFVAYKEHAECILIDPGCSTANQQLALKQFIDANQLKPVCIILTHGHFDHVAGLAWAKSEYNCPLLMHKEDLFLVENASQYAGLFGIRLEKPPEPDQFIEEGPFTWGDLEFTLLHIPGHSPGSICLYAEKEGFVVCGDVLFKGSIGRTDLAGGDHALLLEGIRQKLMKLPRNTVVWPGHGPATTIGMEYDTNPFLN
jgi:glyoxylase-like metal-dependent hydrolase (beta-lactamase superfamily II)